MMIKPQKYRIAFVFNTIYYPFTYPEIISSLMERAFRITAGPPQPDPILAGARLYVSGFIASKQGCYIQLNEGSGMIACEGTIAKNVLDIAREIIDLSKEVFKLDLPRDLDYVELTASQVVSESGNPMESIKKFHGNCYEVFDDVMGCEIAGHSIRLIPKDGTPADRRWFDISITPRFSTSDREYYVETVFRGSNDFESVLDFTSKVDEKIVRLINKVGGS